MITILAHNPAFSGSKRRIFSRWEETRLITLTEHPLWADELDIVLTKENAEYCRSLIEQSRFTMIAGAAGLAEMLEMLGRPKAHWVAYWTDTLYWQMSEMYSSLAEQMRVEVTFAMPDIMPKAPRGTIPLCNPVDDCEIIDKEPPLKIMHSPRTEKKRLLKGTDRIEPAIAKLWLEFPEMAYYTILGLPWQDCLRLKQQAHIFIDQIPPEGAPAGMGTSGNEALAFGSVVLTALHGEEYLKGYFPPPPVIKVYNERELYGELHNLCQCSLADLEIKGREGRAWAEEWLLPDGWLKYVGQYL